MKNLFVIVAVFLFVGCSTTNRLAFRGINDPYWQVVKKIETPTKKYKYVVLNQFNADTITSEKDTLDMWEVIDLQYVTYERY